MANRPRFLATRTISRASAAFIVNGFSTSTCLPARSARIALSRCIGCAVATVSHAGVIYTGRHAYRRADGIAVIPAALLAP